MEFKNEYMEKSDIIRKDFLDEQALACYMNDISVPEHFCRRNHIRDRKTVRVSRGERR